MILEYYHKRVSFVLQASELASTEVFRDMMILAATSHVLEGRKISERMLQKLHATDVQLMEQRRILVMSQERKAAVGYKCFHRIILQRKQTTSG